MDFPMSRFRQQTEDTEDSPLLLRAIALLRVELAHPRRAQRTLKKLAELVSDHLRSCPPFERREYQAGRPSDRQAFGSSVPLRARSKHVLCALELMHENPARRWTIQKLAKASGVSRAVLARQFAAALGAPPFRYLAELRLRRAAELLVTTEASLAEIAALIGYDSEFAFNRAFKRHHGVPPGAFRRQGQGTAPRATVDHTIPRATVESTAPRASIELRAVA
jgi:AraC-like DNA-binding protein